MIADRLETLERKENHGHHALSPGIGYPHGLPDVAGAQEYDLPNSVDHTPIGRKRTHSMSEDGANVFTQRPFSQRGSFQAHGQWGFPQQLSMSERFPDANSYQPPPATNGDFNAAEPFWATQGNARQPSVDLAAARALERDGSKPFWHEHAVDT